MLYFCFGPAAVAVLVAHDLQRGEFVMQVTPCQQITATVSTPACACCKVLSRASMPLAVPTGAAENTAVLTVHA